MIDLLVLGGGPAGAATAITAAERGCSVVVLERARFPRTRPGETLHPGIEPLLRKLGAESIVEDPELVRHPGIHIEWGSKNGREDYGADARGPWLGYQIDRADLDTRLLRRAEEVGARIEYEVEPWELIHSEGRVKGVRSARREWPARWVVDAAGDRHQIARRLKIAIHRHSSPLTARYGYARGSCPTRDEVPRITADEWGWTWTARIGPTRYQWTRVCYRAGGPIVEPPVEFRNLVPDGPTRGRDVTWRIVERPAGPGYFIVGDAASVVDPSSSHGVLRAVMTGMAAGQLIERTVRGHVGEAIVVQEYVGLVRSLFDHDIRRLRASMRW